MPGPRLDTNPVAGVSPTASAPPSDLKPRGDWRVGLLGAAAMDADYRWAHSRAADARARSKMGAGRPAHIVRRLQGRRSAGRARSLGSGLGSGIGVPDPKTRPRPNFPAALPHSL